MAMLTDDEYKDFEAQIKLQEKQESGDQNKDTEKLKEKVDEDGTVYEWDEFQKAWFPKVTEDFLANYQATYGSMREPITSPTGIKYEWNDEKKNYFNEKDEILPEEGFQHEGVCYKYNVETNSWMADGQPLQTNQSQTYKDENGTTYFWNEVKKLWVTEAGICYNAETGEYSDSNTGKIYDPKKMEWVNPKKSDKPKKEKEGIIITKKKEKRKAEWFDQDQTNNTNVYVTGLPTLNFNLEMFANLMKKCGLIKPDEKTQQPKLKLYFDSEGKLKGDGLCCYLAIESVDLALQILDGAKLKDLLPEATEDRTLSVTKAKFELKGNYDASKKKKTLKKKEKLALKKQKEKLLGWGGMGITTGDTEIVKRQRHEKVVVFSNCFTVDEVDKDPTIIFKVKDEMKTICSHYGLPRKINMFDGHPKGIVSVAFAKAEEADRAIENLNKKLFRGRVLTVERWDGHQNFEIEETQAEIENRDSAWKEWLEDDEEED